MYQDIARIVKECREYAGFTQQQLADKVYLDVETIKSYENGRIKNIPEENLAKIADSCLAPWAKTKFLWWTSPHLYRGIVQKQPNVENNHAEITISAIRQADDFRSIIPNLMDFACGRVYELSEKSKECVSELLSSLVALNLKPKEKTARPARRAAN